MTIWHTLRASRGVLWPRIPARRFSVAPVLWNKESVIDHLILDRLKAGIRPQPNPESGNILILDPRKINKRSRNRTRPTKSDVAPTLDKLGPINLDLGMEEKEDSSYIKLINNLRVTGNELSNKRYTELQNQLIESFTATQLREYVKNYYEDPTFQGNKRGVTKLPKKKLTEIILSDLWNITKSNSVSVEDFLVSDFSKLKKSDLFLLLARNGLLIKYLSRTGCKINFDSKGLVIHFVGTENQINSANIILNSMLKQSHTEEVDLSFLVKLLEQKSIKFDAESVSDITSVHFEQTSPTSNVYRLTALNENQIKRAKRLLLWQLDYNLHIQKSVMLPESLRNTSMTWLPYKDDDSLAWNERTKSLFRLSGDVVLNNNELIEQQLEIYKDANLTQSDLFDPKESISEIKSFLIHSPLPKPQVDVIDDENAVISSAEIEKMYGDLTSNIEDPDLTGLDKTKVSPPLFTATFGNLVFEESSPSNDRFLPHMELNIDDLPQKYTFSTNTSSLNDRVLNGPLFDIPSLSLRDLNHFKINDPHKYVIQMKFQPSIFPQDVNSIDKQIKYPPVEVWLDLNQYAKPDLSSLKLLTVENENNCYVLLPNKRSDLKVSCQVTGDFFNQEYEEPVGEVSSIEEILNSTSQKYARYRDQPGLQRFLEESELDFSGRRPTSISPVLDLHFGDETVRYNYLSVSYIRQLEFRFRDRLTQFNLVEGGTLGGRKIEVTMVNDTVSPDDLKTLVRDAIAFINKI